MNDENLKPLKGKGDPRSDKVRAMTKGSSSDKRKIAQRIAGLKKANPKNLPDKISKLIGDPRMSAKEIWELINYIKEQKTDMRKGDLVQLGNLMVKTHIALHGQKNQNLNVNVDLNKEELNKKVYELIGDVRNTITTRDKDTYTESN